MTTTPHGQVPAIQRYKIGYHSDEWGVRSLSPVGIYDDAGPWVRYEDHAAELCRLHAYCQELESQVIRDCMTHVQKPAEIEHVAGDVSKNSAKKNMNDYAELPEPDATTVGLGAVWNRHSMRDFADATHALRTQQPAPAGACYEKGLEDALRERDEADDFIDTLLDEVLGADRAEWSSAYGRADALEEVRERITALHKPAVDRAWKQFEAATQQAGEVRPVTPYTCPKCHALWLHWPAEQTGFGLDTLNCRSAAHCHYCEKAGVEQLQRLERIPAALHAPPPSPAAQAAPAAGAVAGWQWVPTVPTEEMCRAMDGVGDSYMEHGPNIWAAMLAAAPQPLAAPATQQAREVSDRTGCTAGMDEECTRRGCGTNCPASRAQAAESVPALDRTRIREIFMAHGFTVKEGQTDLKQYVYDAAEALLRAARASADSVLEDAALSGDQQRAIFEAYESAASEIYFEARPQIDCNDRRRVFKAGYERGWDAARKQGGA